ncbi:hypothetical protein KM043_000045, partial [Ampulex compressa]
KEKDEEKIAQEADKSFKSLEKKVRELVEFILEKKNLHAELKTMARSVDRTLKEYSELRPENWRVATREQTVRDGETQTSPVFRKEVERKNKRDPPSP